MNHRDHRDHRERSKQSKESPYNDSPSLPLCAGRSVLLVLVFSGSLSASVLSVLSVVRSSGLAFFALSSLPLCSPCSLWFVPLAWPSSHFPLFLCALCALCGSFLWLGLLRTFLSSSVLSVLSVVRSSCLPCFGLSALPLCSLCSLWFVPLAWPSSALSSLPLCSLCSLWFVPLAFPASDFSLFLDAFSGSFLLSWFPFSSAFSPSRPTANYA